MIGHVLASGGTHLHGGLLFFVVAIILYFIPTIVAVLRNLLHNTFSHPPPPGVTQQIVFNITNVTNSPAPVKQVP